ncbi:MAG: phosphoglucomutase [Bacteroidetes bacterium]|nr:MAG: phosphoglucomutase [Bacteroidota bacterium]
MEKRKIEFGTDGWRGLLDDDLNDHNIQIVAQALADYMRLKSKNNRVAVGYDGRRDSDRFARLFAEVLRGNRIDVILSDRIVSTPVVSFTCVHRKCDVGVMITASHNPPQYNGIKFKASNGSPFATEETALVESLLGHSLPSFDEKGIEEIDLMADYLVHVEKLVDFDAIRKAGLRVAIDSMAGSAGTVLEELLKKHGIHAETIFGVPQTDFAGRMAEPVERNLQPLADFLRKGDFSVGLATDGDGDRLGVMTDKGNWMNVQETILYLAQYYKGKKGMEGSLVKTASVTDKMLQLFPESEVADVQVGFKYVAEAMIENDAAFGAEESGGFGFKGHLPERDGIFSGLVLLEMLANSAHKTLESFIAEKRKELGEIYYDRIDQENDSPARYKVLPALALTSPAELANFKVTGMQYYQSSRGQINGLKLRLEGNPRWLLLRVSETEPIVRIYAEGENQQEVQQLLNAGKNLFEAIDKV